MKIRLCIAVSALVGVSSLAHADWESAILPKDFMTASSMSRALEEGKKTNRPVILYYTRTNCPPCDVLQGRLRKPDVARPYRESYVFTAVWGSAMDRMEQQRYRDKYGTRGAPSWVVFANDGQYVCSAPGGFQSDEEGATLHTSIQTKLTAPRPTEGTIVPCI
jgi:thioredoxin-related protein